MKSNAFSAILIIVGMLLLGLVISLQMTILSDWEAPFGLDFGSSSNEAGSSGPGGAQVPSTVAPATPVAVATDTPMIVVVQPTPTVALATSAPAQSTATTTLPTPAQIAAVPGAASVAVSQALPAAGERLLSANRMTISSDDNVLVDVVASNPFAVGFVSYAAYQGNESLVRSVALPAVDGRGAVQPEPSMVTDDVYPLTYPLYLYTSAQTLQSQPEVAAFLGCYLSRAFTDAEQVGLFPPSIPDFAITVATFSQRTGMEPACNAAGLSASTISVMTANSLVPLTQRMVGAFRTTGYAGSVEMQAREVQRSAQLFCEEGLGDIIAVSRALTQDELATCDAAGREMVSFEVAKDALTVVVSQQNSFLTETNLSELQLLFAEGSVWSNVNAGWPSEPIARAVPSDQSGGFAKFISTVFDTSVPQLAMNLNVATATPVSSAGASTGGNSGDAAAPAAPAVAEASGSSGTSDFVIAGVQGRDECTVLAGVVAQVLETNFGKTVSQVVANNTDELFDRLAWDVSDAAQQVDISPCYTDLGDRVYLREKGSKIALMNNTYGQNGEDKLYMIAYSSIPPMLRSEEACIYEFFRNISLEDVATMRGQNPTDWLAQNADMVAEWTRCTESE